MKFLQEIHKLAEAKKEKKKDPRDKSADRYLNYVAGNTIMPSVCSGKTAGELAKEK